MAPGDFVMSIDLDLWTDALAVGAGATVGMDLWNLLLKRVAGIPSLNYCFLGRWLGHMPRGVFRHASIATAPAVRYECAVGWIAHYSIGLVFALAFVLSVPGWIATPTFTPALLYGIGTVVVPMFVLQPALGFGVAGARTPRPLQARLKSLATHTVFGVGLYASALLVRLLRDAGA